MVDPHEWWGFLAGRWSWDQSCTRSMGPALTIPPPSPTVCCRYTGGLLFLASSWHPPTWYGCREWSDALRRSGQAPKIHWSHIWCVGCTEWWQRQHGVAWRWWLHWPVWWGRGDCLWCPVADSATTMAWWSQSWMVSGEVSPDQVEDWCKNYIGKWLYHTYCSSLFLVVSPLFLSGELSILPIFSLTQG
jgi:hypothetical protein